MQDDEARGDTGIVRLGERALRVERRGGSNPRALLRRLRAEAHVVDVVVTEGHVGVHFAATLDDASVARAGAMIRRVERDVADEPDDGAARERVVHVVYDGEDLAEAAHALGMPTSTLVARHSAAVYRVRMIGFLPGFAYLGDLDPALVLPRRASPRTRVPAGSLAIAGPYTAVYPFASPGGWHLLGRALDFPIFELTLGDQVRFEVSPEAGQ